MTERTYSVREAAAMLPEKFSDQDLYYFLKQEGIVTYDRRPSKEYIKRGLLVETSGSRCAYHRELYWTTKFTKAGIEWLINEFHPKIMVIAI